MELTPEQASARLNSPNNLANRFNVPTEGSLSILPFRDIGKRPEIPVFIQQSVSALAHTGEKQRIIAEEFDISRPEVSRLKHGHNIKTKELLEDTKNAVADQALDRLMQSMSLMNDDKLANCKAESLSRIAVAMSTVAKNMLPEEKAGNLNVHLNIYAPSIREEDRYQVVEVQDQK